MSRGLDVAPDRDPWGAFLVQICREGEERIRQDVARLEALGIIDAQGNRIRKDLPPDMQPDSKTDTTT